MLGESSSVLATTASTSAASGGAGGEAPQVSGAHEVGREAGHVGGSNSGEDDRGRADESDRSFGGNRWPRQETLALLKIRADMDVAFRDASVKGPLWEEVARKLGELGYNRSSKKCREKFENVYKYHKRTKEGRTGKQEGKTYRFFDQLEAFEHQASVLLSPAPLSQKPPQQAPAITTTAMPVANPPLNVATSNVTVPSTTLKTAAALASNVSQAMLTPSINLTIPSFPTTNPTILPPSQATNPITTYRSSFPSLSQDLLSNSTSSSTSSDVEIQGRHKRKRKWKDFFERLMREVVQKQEEMQRKFLEAIEKREHERMVREDSWRMQEMARINREREILAQERSIAAAKDAAVMACLQKLSEQQNLGEVQHNLPPPPQPPPAQPVVPPPSQPPVLPPQQPAAPPLQPAVRPLQPTAPTALALPQLQLVAATSVETLKSSDNGDQNLMGASSSRWPKVEVQALIRLRTNLDAKYQESGPKGPLWEEISAGMRKLGYNRSAKRCKEKWENINKYFKKVKESNKKRPEDSKTCPYFHQLDALYREKNKTDGPTQIQFKPENSVPLMVTPEQQWPPPQQEHRTDSVMEDLESDENQNNNEDDDKDNDDEEEDEAGGYEIVANKPATTAMSTAH
ncbi:hypothetical protein K2173_022958 [Erythroxylum novogranatense]|uniref:Myb-like domain-containing protein n=1 Tax=Erythroxylum novogranatense TaxID=1862640 RepID=A0AAV8T933_9ROSI|nr:hypothetical protein K2173_022958 [Erythroxylum novogranatense]